MLWNEPRAPWPSLYLLSQALQEAHDHCLQRTPGTEQTFRRLLEALGREASAAECADVISLTDQLRGSTGELRGVLLRALRAAVLRTPAFIERPTVLLVDDDCDMELLVRVALEPWCIVQVARTLKEAKRAVAQGSFACLLLDLSLPDGDGCQVLVQRRQQGGAFLPCIVLTGSREQYRIMEALALGADGFLIKPVSVGELAANVGRALQRRDVQSRAVYQDSLTEILNRRGFEEAAKRAISFALRTDTPLSLAVLDLDDFKSVNDRFGHMAGDRLLRWFACVLQRYLRREDVPGRWGGDEFVVLFPNSTEGGATRALEKVRQVIKSAPLDLNDLPRLSFSAGVATLRTTTCTVQDLLRVADKNMYGDKATRRVKRPTRVPPSSITNAGPEVTRERSSSSASRLLL